MNLIGLEPKQHIFSAGLVFMKMGGAHALSRRGIYLCGLIALRFFEEG
jgi:hypothetical protein